MKKEYDLKSMKKRPGPVKTYANASKIPVSIRLDAGMLVTLRDEAFRLGIPYQTFLCSILHRYANGELVDKKLLEQKKKLKTG